jgi:hypothetical protein
MTLFSWTDTLQSVQTTGYKSNDRKYASEMFTKQQMPQQVKPAKKTCSSIQITK